MKAEELRKSILQQAIQGKLVAQDPTDEPASVLLERIREEKRQLIKDKKIKKDKNESIIYKGDDNSHYEKIGSAVRCIDDEIPFEIPDSWAWCRLGNICNYGKTESVEPQSIEDNTWVLDLEDVEKQTGVLLRKKRRFEMSISSTKNRFKVGDVLYSKLRPYLNKVLVANENGCCTSEILPLDFGRIYNLYAQMVLMSPYFVDYTIQCSYGTKMPRLGTKDAISAFFPLPPLFEQRRIIEKLNNFGALLDVYNKLEEESYLLDSSLPDTLNKSILQYAIQGKLVVQNPTDEPASVLLERIREEKKRLIKEKKIKVDKNESIIYKGDDNSYYETIGKETSCIDDQIPFEIPERWQWVRLGRIATLCGGFAFKSNSFKDNGIRVIRISDFDENGFKSHKIIRYTYNDSLVGYLIEENNILIAMTGGTVGKSYLVATLLEPMLINQRVAGVKLLSNINPHYIDSVIKSPLTVEVINDAKNSTNDNISMSDIYNFLIPLPPIEEQNRIAEKLCEMKSHLSNNLLL